MRSASIIGNILILMSFVIAIYILGIDHIGFMIVVIPNLMIYLMSDSTLKEMNNSKGIPILWYLWIIVVCFLILNSCYAVADPNCRMGCAYGMFYIILFNYIIAIISFVVMLVRFIEHKKRAEKELN